MIIEWLVACLYLVSILLLILSVRYVISIFKISWSLPFQLTKLFVTILFGILLFISAQQLSKFFISDIGTQISEINVHYLDNKHYLVDIKYSEGLSIHSSFEINGDFWQLDLRIISFNKLLANFGLDCLYRIERIGGRYRSIENEIHARRSLYQLYENKLSDELWSYMYTYMEGRLFRAYYGSALYAPLADQAKYGVFLTDTGAEVLPLNEIAKKALGVWQ